MHKTVFLFSLIALTIITTPSSVIALASTTPSPSPSTLPITDEMAIENAKKRIQSQPDTPDLPPIISARGYIGKVKDVIKDTLIIQDKDGKKDIKLQDDTTILRSPGNATIKAESIRIDDYVIALGYPDAEGTLVARRLIVSADPIQSPLKTSGLGTITKIGKNSLTLHLADKDQVIDLTTKTILKSSVGTIELADLAEGDTLIYTATVGEDDDLTATLIMRIQNSSI